jgi:hypothetical protein
MNKEILINIIGWIGSIEVLIAYGLNSYQKIKSDSLVFYLLNLTGGLFLVVYTIHKEAFASAFVNVVWVFIAVVAMAKFFKQSSHKS